MTDAERRQLHAELAHWQGAIAQLAELDAVAPAEAWAQLEDYLRLRARYLAVESTVEFYGDAVQQRTTPRLGAVLRGLDTIAVDSM